ncbi:pyruvate-ferredoxin/flavodoxin oxidoreductase [Anaerosphaera aminiphila DSM 21120]|uniref:Pyruvate-ferredoxin/flavodoxin oxidoreductase n=1 Tax=Anaerosphaera aminiphila DSM 21120 TaxID=1120995 RepID=A0A1M5SQE9_9FIRM|nr:pyruvate:ferredoxin (flavodoxin) oxidoreductase [Anaerosphaera aminiphila]SHH40749.1 pyruvate-ferredoxin/flavodoxin oxidoreductase [Anaerosphaera aminiphila DSM 21120]
MKKMVTMNGNTAAATVAYAFTEVAPIFPITPSSDMSEHVDEWAANGKKNIFGEEVQVTELQSEGGAAGAMHGALSAGALSTSFTSSQGLLLMIPNMYKMSGELLPGVLHVAARALSTQALSIFGDHQDVMACRQTGFAMLASSSVQEILDLGAVAHLAAIKTRIPFLHFFDGFRTSHEFQKVESVDYEDYAKLLDRDALQEFRMRSMNPERPYTKGTAQNPDVYFQAMEASNPMYEEVVPVVEDYMKKMGDITGRYYKPFDYYGAEDADRIIMAMGSVNETIEETIDYLVKQGEKVGMIKVRLYRPFSKDALLREIPKTVKCISVLDRTKEKGSPFEPLHLDVIGAYADEEYKPVIVGGRYGLASKDTTPSQIKAVFDNMKEEKPKDRFTIGIVDDVTHTNLEIKEEISTEPEDTIKCKFWGFGSDGTVGANKSAIAIIGDGTDMYAQAYFSYDSKKSGGVTISHLRFGNEPIKSTYLITKPDFVSCSKQSYVYNYDLLEGLKEGGTFLLNTIWNEEELSTHLPAKLKRELYDKKVKFYTVDATEIAEEIGLGNRTNMIMQAAFFKLSKVLPLDDAEKRLKDSIKETYGRKGDKIVNMNYEAVDKGFEEIVEIKIPEDWKDAKDEVVTEDYPKYVKDILFPLNAQQGDKTPVSAFKGVEEGIMPTGTARYEKRAIAVTVPKWDSSKCIQCNQCSFVCPHAVIRPFLLNEEESANKPESFTTIPAKGKGLEGMEYRIQPSILDCTGCGNCADVCPSKEKALTMVPLEEEMYQKENWEFAMTVRPKEDLIPDNTIKGSQFKQPLLEFHGACAGCGETPYATLVTRLFGDRMLIANASGCSSIWGGSYPSSGYCKNQYGRGPAWASSLFEDNAEYGYGMALAVKKLRNTIKLHMEEYIKENPGSEAEGIFKEWIENMKDPDKTKALKKPIEDFVKDSKDKNLHEIDKLKDYLMKQSIWSFGGDGWAYDIGYGGLDHVMASGEDFNILVFDTEVYSNTGGQSSKSTPRAAVAKFAAGGKKVRKKDLGAMLMTYGYVYVAQVAMGSNMNQLIKALKEAESYDGPSIVICYSPCINHGLVNGMGKTVAQEKFAVETGYWHLYRYNPMLESEGKNPFVLDSKEPTKPFQSFLDSEVRYTSLKKTFPEIAQELYNMAEEDAKVRYNRYKKMAEV